MTELIIGGGVILVLMGVLISMVAMALGLGVNRFGETPLPPLCATPPPPPPPVPSGYDVSVQFDRDRLANEVGILRAAILGEDDGFDAVTLLMRGSNNALGIDRPAYVDRAQALHDALART